MCGIAGMIDLGERRSIPEALLSRMNDTLYHRGPDDSGLHVEPGVGLAHRRLSIIDLTGGRQPLYNEDGSVVVVYNGEIYNFQDLTRELTALGHTFRTHCDTEVLVHAWEEWREECVRRLRGMFAFGLWDRNSQTFFLARDRLGIKPLYYAYLPNDQMIFGSELKALLVHPDLSREMDPRSVEDFFAYGYVPEPRTILRYVWKLPPGHTLTLSRHSMPVKPREYWDVPFRATENGGEDEVAEELIRRLKEAVKIRLIADVPLGAFLSGGVDSSAVVAMMAAASAEPVNTCSISFGDPSYNEAPYAGRVAARYGTRHQVEQVDPNDYELIDKLASIYDEPYADSSAIPTYRVCELARKRVKVALSGDGGDESFAGYRRYRWHMHERWIRAALPGGVRRPLFALLGQFYPRADWAPKILRFKSTFESLSRDPLEGYFHSISLQGDSFREKLISPQFRRDLQGYRAIEVLRAHAERAPEHPLSRVQYLDFKTYLVGDILTKVDRASMAHSLEVRVPILDHELVEWVSGLPPRLKLRFREGKYVFKRALRPYVPDDILYRPKMGFAVPLATWFRGPLRERVQKTVLGQRLADTGIVNVKFLRQVVDDHQSGLRDYSNEIWSLLMLDAFLRHNMGYGPSPAEMESARGRQPLGKPV